MKSSWRDEPIRAGPEQGGSPSTDRARQGTRTVGSPSGFASWSPQLLETPFAAELSSGVVVCFLEGKEGFVLKENLFSIKAARNPSIFDALMQVVAYYKLLLVTLLSSKVVKLKAS